MTSTPPEQIPLSRRDSFQTPRSREFTSATVKSNDVLYVNGSHSRTPSEDQEENVSLRYEWGYPIGANKSKRWRKEGNTKYIVIVGIIALIIAGFLISRRGRNVDMIYNHGNKRKALVIASFSKQKVEWLSDIPPDWEIYRYFLDTTPNRPLSNLALTVPRNQGREAMAYTTFILDNYHDLPDYVVFIHGHGRSWHQVETMPMRLKALNLTALDYDDYINLRCQLPPTCTPDKFVDATEIRYPLHQHPQDRLMPGFWRTMFPEELNYWGMGPAPSAIGAICCAQFAVTKKAIQLRSKAFWEMFRAPMMRDMAEYNRTIGLEINSFNIGLLYELVWHMVFGKDAIYCPATDYCQKTQFSDKMQCDWYPDNYKVSEGWENITCEWKGD